MTQTERDLNDLDLLPEVAAVVHAGRAELAAVAEELREVKARQARQAEERHRMFVAGVAGILMADGGLPSDLAGFVGVPDETRGADLRVWVELPGCERVYRTLFRDTTGDLSCGQSCWQARPADASLAANYPTFAQAVAVARAAKLNELPL